MQKVSMDWKGGGHKKALLAWDRLCWPKTTGGLNILDIGIWNKAAICKLLWSLNKKKDKMWIQWAHLYYKRYTTWGEQPKQASWVVQKIIKAKKYFEEVGYSEEKVRQMDKFSIKDMYLKLRGDFTKVSWRRMTCNNAGLPKWTFTLYRVAHRSLLTRERLGRWGLLEDTACALCNSEEETIEHLFFKCSFSAQVWTAMLEWQGIKRQVMTWGQELEWDERECKGKNCKAEVYRIVLPGSIYYIWQERNERIFQARQRSAEAITRQLA
ncbi:uncharacterized protein LOC142172448 [Nicotiana tabacum]|uniref:Uncharacterized protein LOC142172448 n=1 Tax=Nicotiana tabacum TaxID=4097 RepID=A0AC58T4K3_TOBAC